MALYLGNGEKLKINLNNSVCRMNFYTENPVTNGVRLLSSDGYILKDINGLYLIAKGDE